MSNGSPGKRIRLVERIKRGRSKNAESHREKNELRRVLAEQQRELLSSKQQTAANDHQVAEQDRAISEGDRKTAENERVQAEYKRQEAEESRETNEDFRAIRERNRQYSDLLKQTAHKVQQETEALLAEHSILQQTVREQMDLLKMNSTTPLPFDQTRGGLQKKIVELEARMDEWTTEIRTANQHLEAEQKERKRAEEALQIMEQARLVDQLNIELNHRLNEQSEKERRVIGRELHDGPIQTLSSAVFDIQVLKEALRDEHIDPQRQTELEQIRVKIKTIIQELRDMVNDLRPTALAHFGLAKTIGIHFQDIQNKHPELAFDIQMEDDRGKLTEDACLTLYRAYQEALNNIIQHANATKAGVHLFFANGMVMLEIADNGKGMDTIPDLISQASNGHFGLAGMKERVEGAGGAFAIQSYPGKGTTIRLSVPITKSSP